MGRLREQPQGEVLQAHRRRQTPGRPRTARVAGDHRHHCPLLRTRRRNSVRALRVLLLRLGNFLGQSRREREFQEELEAHLQMHIDDNLRAGMTEAEARREALLARRRRTLKESMRDRWTLAWLETWGRTSATASAACAAIPVTPPPPPSPSPSASVPASPSSPSPMACSSGRCPTGTPPA